MLKRCQCLKCDKNYTTFYLRILGTSDIKKILCHKCRKQIKKDIVVTIKKKII